MIRLTRSQVQPIGVDLGADSIKLLQLEVVGESLSVVAAARQPAPPEARSNPELRRALAIDAVRQMLRSNAFHGRRIVASLPREIVHVKNIRLPMMPPSEVESAVNFEARNIFPFDTDRALVRYLPAGEVRQGNDTKLEIIALAAPLHEVNEFVEQIHRCGCVIESLDFEPCAIYRGIERFIRRREDENEVHVLVDLGARRTQMIIGKGRDISFYKPVEIGAIHLQDAVSQKLGISAEEAGSLRRRLVESFEARPGSALNGAGGDPVRQAVYDATRSTIEELGRELSLCLRYYSVTFRGQRPTKVRLVGGEAGDAHLLQVLSAALPIPIEPCRTLGSVNSSRMKLSDRRGYTSEWAAAFGMGLKLTRGYYGSRDGKRREPSASPAAYRGDVEVVDLGKAVQDTTLPAAGAPGADRAARPRLTPQEAARA